MPSPTGLIANGKGNQSLMRNARITRPPTTPRSQMHSAYSAGSNHLSPFISSSGTSHPDMVNMNSNKRIATSNDFNATGSPTKRSRLTPMQPSLNGNSNNTLFRTSTEQSFQPVNQENRVHPYQKHMRSTWNWLGTKYNKSATEPPISSLRAVTGFDFPFPKCAGVVLSHEQFNKLQHMVIAKKQQTVAENHAKQFYNNNGHNNSYSGRTDVGAYQSPFTPGYSTSFDFASPNSAKNGNYVFNGNPNLPVKSPTIDSNFSFGMSKMNIGLPSSSNNITFHETTTVNKPTSRNAQFAPIVTKDQICAVSPIIHNSPTIQSAIEEEKINTPPQVAWDKNDSEMYLDPAFDLIDPSLRYPTEHTSPAREFKNTDAFVWLPEVNQNTESDILESNQTQTISTEIQPLFTSTSTNNADVSSENAHAEEAVPTYIQEDPLFQSLLDEFTMPDDWPPFSSSEDQGQVLHAVSPAPATAESTNKMDVHDHHNNVENTVVSSDMNLPSLENYIGAGNLLDANGQVDTNPYQPIEYVRPEDLLFCAEKF